jgi:hypothetical protein
MSSSNLPRTFNLTSIVFTLLLALGFSLAQEARPLARHPGDVIKYEIKFDGPNAEKIKAISASLSIRGPVQKDQSGFGGGFGTNSGAPVSPDTFHVDLTVPDNIATGDYYLNVGANAAEGSANYRDGQEFEVPAVHIENPKKFTPPAITVKPLP